MQTIKVQSTKREELIEITDEVEKHIPGAGEGICVEGFRKSDDMKQAPLRN